MKFSFSKEQDMLRRSFVEYLSTKCTSEERRKWLESEEGYSMSVWRDISELGWPGLIYDEKYGGMSGSFLEMYILCEEIGKSLLPSPLYASAVLAGMLIDAAGSEQQKEEYLPDLIEGKRVFTLAYLDRSGGCDAEAPAVSAVPAGNGAYSLEGVRLFVPYAHAADKMLVCTNVSNHTQTGPTLFMVGAKSAGVNLSSLKTISAEKRFAVRLDKVTAKESDIIGEIGKGNAYIQDMLAKATVLKCAEMLGGLKQVLDMTVAHVKERHQFGKPLGSFQAIQYYCADMSADLEGGRLLAHQAAALLDRGERCYKEVAMAKAWCSDAYPRCCAMSHQIFGAYGFTEECDLHL
ncbi:MAG: acyl-CoA dehydrogenase family protein, partial [Syntrophobacteraceae bacterium]